MYSFASIGVSPMNTGTGSRNSCWPAKTMTASASAADAAVKVKAQFQLRKSRWSMLSVGRRMNPIIPQNRRTPKRAGAFVESRDERRCGFSAPQRS